MAPVEFQRFVSRTRLLVKMTATARLCRLVVCAVQDQNWKRDQRELISRTGVSRLRELSSSRRGIFACDERQKIRIDLLRIGGAHPMGKARIDLELSVPDDLRGD